MTSYLRAVPRAVLTALVPGLAALRRPATPTVPAFDLAHVRPHPGIGPTVLQIPGGPGVAVPLPYRVFRRRAAAAGLDVIMVEHRGVGLSRRDTRGRDLPAEALSVPQAVEDLAAVLRAEGTGPVIVSGSSYGSYLAAAFALGHPELTAGVVLDSPVLGAEDYRTVRSHARTLLWHGHGGPDSARCARKIRTLVQRDGWDPIPLGLAALLLVEAGGTRLLERYLDQLVVRRAPLTRRALALAARHGDLSRLPHLVEPDLVAAISHGELRFGSPDDGGIFDPAPLLAIADAPAFSGEHYDLPADLARIDVPSVVLVGDQDLQTPHPLARAAVRALPRGVLVPIPQHGHSALDSRPNLLIAVLGALAAGEQDGLPARAAHLAATTPRRGLAVAVVLAVRLLLAADLLLVPIARHPGTPTHRRHAR